MISTQQALNWRYATKKFDDSKKLSSEHLDLLIEAARLAPTSFGLQPFRLMIVEDKEVRERLKAASWNQEQVVNASHLLVFVAIKDLSEANINDYLNLTASERGLEVTSLEGFKNMMIVMSSKMSAEQKLAWVQKQAYIAAGFVMLAAAEAEIDSCPMEGFDASQYDSILGLAEKGLTASIVLPVGYRSAEDQSSVYKKVRLPVDKFVV